MAATTGLLAAVAAELGATPAQVSPAWLLVRAPVVCPMPGTASLAHLAENVAAADLELTGDHLRSLAGLGRAPAKVLVSRPRGSC